jgi:hypothetical protein
VGEIAARLKIAPAEVTDILRHRRILSVGEVASLAGLFNLDPAEFEPLADVPDELAYRVERPRYRSAIRQRAVSSGLSEGQIRLDVVVHVLPMAARTTGSSRGVTNWDELIEDYLESNA